MDKLSRFHYSDNIRSTMASQITTFTTVYSTIHSGADQRKHQSSASMAFVRGIHWGPVNAPHTGPVTRKMFPLDDVIIFERNRSMTWDSNCFFDNKPHWTPLKGKLNMCLWANYILRDPKLRRTSDGLTQFKQFQELNLKLSRYLPCIHFECFPARLSRNSWREVFLSRSINSGSPSCRHHVRTWGVL